MESIFDCRGETKNSQIYIFSCVATITVPSPWLRLRFLLFHLQFLTPNCCRFQLSPHPKYRLQACPKGHQRQRGQKEFVTLSIRAQADFFHYSSSYIGIVSQILQFWAKTIKVHWSQTYNFAQVGRIFTGVKDILQVLTFS